MRLQHRLKRTTGKIYSEEYVCFFVLCNSVICLTQSYQFSAIFVKWINDLLIANSLKFELVFLTLECRSINLPELFPSISLNTLVVVLHKSNVPISIKEQFFKNRKYETPHKDQLSKKPEV